MDTEGLDLAVLFPSRGLFVLGLDSAEHIGSDGLEPAYASAIARAYNDWLADFCKHAPDRMFGAAMVAPHDIEGAVLEARRCVEELGFKAVFLAPGCVNRKPWHHPDYDRLWGVAFHNNAIYAVGYVDEAGNKKMVVAKYNTNAELDTTWGTNSGLTYVDASPYAGSPDDTATTVNDPDPSVEEAFSIEFTIAG